MRALALAFLLTLIAAPAHAIPGVTIPFPEDVEEDMEEAEDAVSDVVLDTAPQGDDPGAGEPLPPTEAGPWLDSSDYPRPELVDGDVVRLVWQVQVQDTAGEGQGEPVERVLLIGPGFALDTGETPPVLYDFTHQRRLVIDEANGRYRNTSFYGDVRRRLDTYLALSRGGTLDDIPFGPGNSFDRFWLESAMGLRRTPADLSRSEEEGRIVMSRAGGLDIFSIDASVLPPANEAEAENAANPQAEADEEAAEEATGEEEFAGVPTDDIAALLRGDGPAGAEATEEALAVEEVAPGPEADRPAVLSDTRLATAFRGWMRHALPIHPDAFDAVDDAVAIPQHFSFVVVSPNSPEGRREVWTLNEVAPVDPDFPLPEGLAPGFTGPLEAAAGPASDAIAAIDRGNPPASADIAERAGELREQGELALAYLTLYQDSAHRGQCPANGGNRPACLALGSLVANSLGNAEFETLFTGLAGLSTGDAEAAFGAVEPYLDAPGFAGAAANLIAGNELIAWAAEAGAEAELPDADPFQLLAASAERDPYAPAIYWHLAQAHLATNRADAAWALLDLGRALPGGADHELLRQAGVLELRLSRLAPDFFP